MWELIKRLGSKVKGVITGFDRIVFKGSILPLMRAQGAMDFCAANKILNKNYRRWMLEQTENLIQAADQYARTHCGAGIMPLNSWRIDKEKLARARQQEKGINDGLIGVWSCLESCRSFRAAFCAQSGYPQLRLYDTQCRHLYFYSDHPDYGFMNVRVQTWFPYSIQICVNGRQWLRRSLEKHKLEYLIAGNKFMHIADYERAQQLLDRQLDARWNLMLDELAAPVMPAIRQALGPYLRHYWTLWQSEWATDLIFHAPADIQPLMTDLLRHAWMTGTSTRVLRYMDRPLNLHGKPFASCKHDVYTRMRDFRDGMRIRHWIDHNSVKAYNEFNVLRIEMTMNTPDMFRVHRHAQGQSVRAKKQMRPLRKGIADITLRTKVSQEINNRFMKQISAFSTQTPVRDIFAKITCGFVKNQRRIRALEPAGKDQALLQAISDPAFALAGITNATLCKLLKNTPWGHGRSQTQLTARISRHLRLLRDHGLIRKCPNQRRYQLTDKGRLLTTSLNVVLNSSVKQLMEIAA